ncbi:hypothetical protein BB558_004409 [Smittium angustum]|uniref:Uncharacterized protein n=1 Tax=Smittium angustum TaxID=133377 RepID=A0A2U1J3A5_SMIAN|nr:hypothetical protein BB558_004409 [Smittium angustum]
MEGFFSNIAVQTAALVGKAAFGAAGTLALKHVSEYIKKVPKSASKQHDFIALRTMFETKLKAIIPAIDLIDIITARGNSTMKTILPLTNSLRKDITRFISTLERLDKERLENSKKLNRKLSNFSKASISTKFNLKNSFTSNEFDSEKYPSDSEASESELFSKNYKKDFMGIPQNNSFNLNTESESGSSYRNAQENDSFLLEDLTTYSIRNDKEYIERISEELKLLLSKIDQTVPLLNLALATSGIHLSGAIPTGISTSRLLQASSHIYRASLQYETYVDSINSQHINSKNQKILGSSSSSFSHSRKKKNLNSAKPSSNIKTTYPGSKTRQERKYKKSKSFLEKIDVGQPFNLKLFSLFSGSVREKSLSDFTWKEHYPKCQIKLTRNLNIKDTSRRLASNNNISGIKGELEEFSYSLVCTENINDGRYHEEMINNVNNKISSHDFIPGKTIQLPLNSISQLYYSSSGLLLNIEGSNSPVLVLQVKKETFTEPKAFRKKKSKLSIERSMEKLSISSISESGHKERFKPQPFPKTNQPLKSFAPNKNNNIQDNDLDENANDVASNSESESYYSSSESEQSSNEDFNDKSNNFDGYIWFALQNEDTELDTESEEESLSSESESNVTYDLEHKNYQEIKKPELSHVSHSKDNNDSEEEISAEADKKSEQEFTEPEQNYSENNNNKPTVSDKNHEKNDADISADRNGLKMRLVEELSPSKFQQTNFEVEDEDQSNLSLLECLIRLSSLEMSLQQSHLIVSDEKLNLFLSDNVTETGVQSTSQYGYLQPQFGGFSTTYGSSGNYTSSPNSKNTKPRKSIITPLKQRSQGNIGGLPFINTRSPASVAKLRARNNETNPNFFP